METMSLPGCRSTAFPTTVGNARVLSRAIVAERAEKKPWRAIAAKTSMTRIECIRLAHVLEEVVTEIKSTRAGMPYELPGRAPVPA